MRKESKTVNLKEFLKPEWRKILITCLLSYVFVGLLHSFYYIFRPLAAPALEYQSVFDGWITVLKVPLDVYSGFTWGLIGSDKIISVFNIFVISYIFSCIIIHFRPKLSLPEVLIILIIICVLPFFLIYINFEIKPQPTYFVSQHECQTIYTLSCNDYKSKGFPSDMPARFFCKNGKPQECGCKELKNAWYEKSFYVNSGDWWDCIAPVDCRDTYGIKIDNQTDCP
jgi:hypothetical protein